MLVLSHRGDWRSVSEKNSDIALARSFDAGFGVETDLRDLAGTLVISHDPPAPGALTAATFISLPRMHSLPLALNIKSDGLASLVKGMLDSSPIRDDAFVFDMSVPDMASYFDAGIPVFTRLSEVEREPAWLDRAAGVWLDSFGPEWYTVDVIKGLLSRGKRVCIVSPELHGRPHEQLWERVEELASDPLLMLCTDLPHQAADRFDGRS